MAGGMRAEPTHLDIVTQQVRGPRNIIWLAREETLLVVKARPPREAAADLDVFSENMPHHVARLDAFGRVIVVQTASRVDVVITTDPAVFERINPAIYRIAQLGWLISDD